jgi:hypothetical protein
MTTVREGLAQWARRRFMLTRKEGPIVLTRQTDFLVRQRQLSATMIFVLVALHYFLGIEVKKVHESYHSISEKYANDLLSRVNM